MNHIISRTAGTVIYTENYARCVDILLGFDDPTRYDIIPIWDEPKEEEPLTDTRNTITRTERGLHAHAKPGNELDKETFNTFASGLNRYGYLVKEGERITLVEFAIRILIEEKQTFARDRFLHSLDNAMIDIP